MQEDTKKFLREIMKCIKWESGMPDRRESMSNDHDLLLRIDEKLTNVVSTIESVVNDLESHKLDDIKLFEKIADKQSVIEKKISFYAGGLAVLIIAVKLFLKV